MNEGQMDTKYFPEEKTGASLKFPATFALTLSPSRANRLDITVVGVDSAGVAVAKGSGFATIIPGGQVGLTVNLVKDKKGISYDGSVDAPPGRVDSVVGSGGMTSSDVRGNGGTTEVVGTGGVAGLGGAGVGGNSISTPSMDSGRVAIFVMGVDGALVMPDTPLTVFYDAYKGPMEDVNCSIMDFVLDRAPAPLVLAQDRSYSMSQPVKGPGIGPKWDNVRAAIQEVVQQTNTNVAWGLKLFPNEKACQVSVGPEIAPRLMNADPIIQRLDSIKSERTTGNLTDGTPTHKLLNDLREYLVKLGAVNKYIVLVTDGEPSCASDKPTASNYEEARAAARAVVQVGIKIAVVGISISLGVGYENESQDSALVFLNYVAELGGMPANNPDNPNIKYYPAENTNEMVKTFLAITEQVYSCTFRLPKVPPHKNDVAVKLDGIKVSHDANHGWEYDDDTLTSLTLHGSTCEKIKDMYSTVTKVDVKIFLGCPGVVIP